VEQIDTYQPYENHLTLRECVVYFAAIPDKFLDRYQIRPMVSEAIDLVGNLRHSYLGRAGWLTHELFNYNSEPPSELTETDFSQYSPFGVMSKATLELCRATRYSSPLLKETFRSPAHLWLMCEISDFFQAVVETNLGTYLQLPEFTKTTKKLKGKDELYQEYLEQADLRKDASLAVESFPFSNLQIPDISSVLLTEARKLAKKHSDFQDLHWDSYWITSDWFLNQIRHSENFQVTYLLQQGIVWSLWRGGKGKKLPSTESKGFIPKRPRGRPPKSGRPKV